MRCRDTSQPFAYPSLSPGIFSLAGYCLRQPSKNPFQNGRVNPCIHARFFGTLEVSKNISFVATSPRGTRSTVAADALRFYFCISICSRFHLSLRQMIVRYITIPPPHLSITTYSGHFPSSDNLGLSAPRLAGRAY